LKRQIEAGIDIASDQVTVQQFLDRWLNEVICHRRPRTQESYRGTAKLHVTPHVGHYKIQKLKPEHVQNLVTTLVKGGLGPRSVEYAVKVLSRGLNQAKRWGYITKNPADGVELPDVKQRRVRPVDEQQARALLTAVKDHRLEAVYWVVLFLGLRRGEVLGLLKENLDMKAMTLTVEGTLQRINGSEDKLVRSDPKTEASRRVLPIPEPLVKVLRDHLRRLEAERAKAGDAWEEHGYLFPSERGTPLDPRNLLRHFEDVLVAAELPETTHFHDLRHWCASLLISYDVHPKAIQDILGHANIKTTLNIYGHLLPKVLRDATGRMSGIAPPDEDSDTSPDDTEDCT